MNFKDALAHYVPQIEAEMRSHMAVPNNTLDDFFGMLHYHMGWLDKDLQPIDSVKGKRLRPLFTLLCCQAAGGNSANAMTAAAAVELIHNFSLIHDDIEDQSDMRHGRTTVWSIWGEAQAINAGDAMFVLARNALLKLQTANVPAETILAAISKLDDTCLKLCRGQFLDMRFESTMSVTLDAYLEMIAGKTAALLACSGYLGGLIATDNVDEAEDFWRLGHALGLAFQIQDDHLGIWGDAALTGKPTADDLRRHKKSLPVVYALNQVGESAKKFRDLYNLPVLDEAHILDAINLLEDLGAKSYTETLAQKYVDDAETALNTIDAPAENKLALQEMAYFLIKRAY